MSGVAPRPGDIGEDPSAPATPILPDRVADAAGSPFTLVGDDAGLCVDGVCVIPGGAVDGENSPGPA